MDIEQRPWGSFEVLSDEPTHKVKRLVVDPGQRLSYQRHAHRSEHWVIVTGTGTVTLDGVDATVSPGDAVDVECGAKHRISNSGIAPLVFIEVQLGTSFAESDIERFDDDYGRASTGL